MKRRRFLATSGIALLGGCTFGDPGESSTETPTVTPAPSDEPTGTPSGNPGEAPSVTADELRERRVVAEQLFRRRFRAYRNTLPAFEPGVERLLLRTDWSTVDETAGLDDRELTVAYDGERFHVEGETPAG